MLRYHLRYMGVKVINPSPIFVYSIIVVLNANNPRRSFNNKTVILSYYFLIENVANDVVEVCKIDTK